MVWLDHERRLETLSSFNAWNLSPCLLVARQTEVQVGRRPRKLCAGHGTYYLGSCGIVQISDHHPPLSVDFPQDAVMGDEAGMVLVDFKSASSKFLLRYTTYRHARIRGFLVMEQSMDLAVR